MYNENVTASNHSSLPHSVSIEGREKMTVFGVQDVENFDEKNIAMVTSEGKLTVIGENLHIEKLDLNDGELIITGIISSAVYSDSAKATKGGFLSRLFG